MRRTKAATEYVNGRYSAAGAADGEPPLSPAEYFEACVSNELHRLWVLSHRAGNTPQIAVDLEALIARVRRVVPR